MSYVRARSAVLCFLVLYAALGIYGHITRQNAEDLYPFFSWSLFAQVPDREQTAFEVRMISDGAQTFPLPVPLAESGLRMRIPLNDYALNEFLNQFGRTTAGWDGGEIAAFRRDFESTLPTGAAYELVLIRFDPIKRFLFGEIATSAPIARFTAHSL